ncbi:MAG: nucleotidyltransferase family protein [Bacteroidota bacterium]
MKVTDKNNLYNLFQINHEKIKSLGVSRIGLFGSFVRNEQTEKSDVDLLIEFQQGEKNFINFMNLSFFLEELMERKVEIVTPESMSKYFAPYILKEVEYVAFA